MPSSRQDKTELVARYFDDHAVDFDTIYKKKKGTIRELRDRLTRATVLQRLDLVCSLALVQRSQTALDVGCGSGRFCIALAKLGVAATGLDVAPKMLSIAGVLAVDAGVESKCSFVEADFTSWIAPRHYDLGLAIGVMDYVSDPVGILGKLAETCDGVVVVSFPRLLHYLAPVRYARLRLADCPIRFYRQAQVNRLAKEAGLTKYYINVVARDYVLVGSRE